MPSFTTGVANISIPISIPARDLSQWYYFIKLYYTWFVINFSPSISVYTWTCTTSENLGVFTRGINLIHSAAIAADDFY